MHQVLALRGVFEMLQVRELVRDWQTCTRNLCGELADHPHGRGVHVCVIVGEGEDSELNCIELKFLHHIFLFSSSSVFLKCSHPLTFSQSIAFDMKTKIRREFLFFKNRELPRQNINIYVRNVSSVLFSFLEHVFMTCKIIDLFYRSNLWPEHELSIFKIHVSDAKSWRLSAGVQLLHWERLRECGLHQYVLRINRSAGIADTLRQWYVCKIVCSFAPVGSCF